MNATLDLQPGDKILISRTDRLGDLILSLPFVETIKVRHPECQVHVLASLYASPVLEHNDRIDKIVRVQNDQLSTSRGYYRDLERKIRQTEYKAVVVLFPERRISRLLYRTGIGIRLGTAGRFHSVFFTHHLLHSRKANKKHEFEYNLDFLKFFRDGETIRKPRVISIEKEIRNARRIVAEAGVEGAFVTLHPGSGGSADAWPIDRFFKLSERLTHEGIDVVFTGSETEREMIAHQSELLGIPVKNIAGRTDLRTLAAVLSLSSTVVANSTGPLHLATAVDTRVVGLYPGRQGMSPKRWGPVGDSHKVVQPPALERGEATDADAHMETIEVDSVFKAVRQVYGDVAE